MKSPAFQVYVNDFLGSAKVGMMSTEEVGAYWLLLCLEWQEEGFVYSETQLARWCRLTPTRFRKAWVTVGPCFVEIDGRLYNPRLQKEREKQEAWRAKSAKGGKKSGEARAKGGSQVVEPTPQPNGNTPLPLPLPLQVTTKAKATEKQSPFPMSDSRLLYDAWIRARGAVEFSAFRKALMPLYPESGALFTIAQLIPAIEAFAEHARGLPPDKAKFENVYAFAGDPARWVRVGAMPAVDPVSRELTERGRLALT